MDTRLQRQALPNPRQSGTDAAVAAYIVEAAAELSLLAHRHDMPVLAYILDMARLEAESQASALTKS
ncbi:hypothetical protein [Blastochloris viridis]|uniref:Uncharacterized protein n=1 Tax=Blastochloris viridis TaxID=1079 RepID=A0A0H5BEN4_BLAVI|nr:hypothetical protein [Blastochloris viridis]ALK09438.1 hypothetical protein BVIR_1659 [Blastochloris viridis]BAS00681.1 hypothetical protein BV133_3087 [Blastochloris viridis]CUU42101.1 hypothetical protein BVIRIDIS_11040 [Blastochloris viridis]